MSTLPLIKKPVNYLNNKDILKEIHLSKNSYCSYIKPEYHQYDMIIDLNDNQNLHDSLAYICRDEIIKQAREAKASREKIDESTISKTDLIFRVMTWDHIPLAPKQPRKSAKPKSAKEIFEFEEEENLFEDLEDPELAKEMGMNDMVHIRVNFPPFQHFKFDEYNNLICVGKSHWKGDLKSGAFNKDHGQVTSKLAKMYLMLCEKYAMRFNWRGYTYVDEMKCSAILQLTYVGLRFNESKSQNPFAYYTAAINNSFRRVLNSEKRNQSLRDDILEMNNLQPSWTRQYANEGGHHDD